MITTSSKKTLLLIDDEYVIQQIMQVCLDNLSNWKMLIATSGKEGLRMIAQAKPDAVLLDMMMPDMNGFEVLAKLQADAELADIPVILLTACTSRIANHQTLLELGCKGLISKPFEPLTIVSQIAKILGWQP
ncbi:MAG: response regulator [Pseudanabaena sp.]